MISDALGPTAEIGVQVGTALAAIFFSIRGLVWAQRLTQATMSETNRSLRESVASLTARQDHQQEIIDGLRDEQIADRREHVRQELEWSQERLEMLEIISRLQTQVDALTS